MGTDELPDKVTMKQVSEKKLWLPDHQKRDGGSYFDDELPDKDPDQVRSEQNSLNIREELRARPGVAIFVGNHDDATEMRKVLSYWMERREIVHVVPVIVDSTVPPQTIRIERP